MSDFIFIRAPMQPSFVILKQIPDIIWAVIISVSLKHKDFKKKYI